MESKSELGDVLPSPTTVSATIALYFLVPFSTGSLDSFLFPLEILLADVEPSPLSLLNFLLDYK